MLREILLHILCGNTLEYTARHFRQVKGITMTLQSPKCSTISSWQRWSEMSSKPVRAPSLWCGWGTSMISSSYSKIQWRPGVPRYNISTSGSQPFPSLFLALSLVHRLPWHHDLQGPEVPHFWQTGHQAILEAYWSLHISPLFVCSLPLCDTQNDQRRDDSYHPKAEFFSTDLHLSCPGTSDLVPCLQLQPQTPERHPSHPAVLWQRIFSLPFEE